jgi:hypothetical protein
MAVLGAADRGSATGAMIAAAGGRGGGEMSAWCVGGDCADGSQAVRAALGGDEGSGGGRSSAADSAAAAAGGAAGAGVTKARRATRGAALRAAPLVVTFAARLAAG